MFTLIAHKDKEKTKFFDKPGVPSVGFVYPAKVMVKTTSGYKVLDLYTLNSNGHIYAKNGQYYICLMRSGLTSNSKITWTELDGIDEVYDKNYLTHYNPMEV